MHNNKLIIYRYSQSYSIIECQYLFLNGKLYTFTLLTFQSVAEYFLLDQQKYCKLVKSKWNNIFFKILKCN